MDYSDVGCKMYTKLQDSGGGVEGRRKDTGQNKQTNQKKTSENKISTNMPPYGESRSLHRVWNAKCENPLTGTEPGTSLKVYSVLLARGCCASSSHTEWEEERRFTKERKDCRDREEDFISQLHPSLFLHFTVIQLHFWIKFFFFKKIIILLKNKKIPKIFYREQI